MPDHIPEAGKMVPRRIHLRRTKGWRMPENTVSVARPTKWGNPFRELAVINWHLGDYYDDRNAIWREEAVALFRAWATEQHPPKYWICPGGPDHPYSVAPCALDFRELRGKNLACWCPLSQPCHADVLLELANAPLRCEGV